MEIRPRGIVPAMLTIFDKNDNLDLEGQKRFAEWLIGKGVHGLAPTGSTAEGAALSDDEKVMVIKATVEGAKGRVPVYAGYIGYSTKLACETVKKYKDVGASGVMCLLPFYYKPNVKDAMQHIRDVSKAWGGPIMVYNNPWFAGYELTPEQIKVLADEGYVNSVKCAHGDPMRCDYVKYVAGDKVTALYGHDYAPLEAFCLGADGWLSGLPNVIPDLCVELFDAIDKEHDLEKGRKIWDKILPIAYYFMYVRRANDDPHWLPMIKNALRMQGVDVGYPRLPATDLDVADKKILFDNLAKVYPDIKLV
ncbi:dihydrodipicolinate synthase family protein [uncultured Sphaerochaeta sp.]|uniref:dihydrodipicolinate synthase family protein n=1 Tax=uncultured Sphaerochaeta sp. TaxID=886478 RepID=UPI002A0A60BD|nr:dihydrodipicolinate synthase family protein [uncultured Sphaerochaeta sp.]